MTTPTGGEKNFNNSFKTNFEIKNIHIQNRTGKAYLNLSSNNINLKRIIKYRHKYSASGNRQGRSIRLQRETDKDMHANEIQNTAVPTSPSPFIPFILSKNKWLPRDRDSPKIHKCSHRGEVNFLIWRTKLSNRRKRALTLLKPLEK